MHTPSLKHDERGIAALITVVAIIVILTVLVMTVGKFTINELVLSGHMDQSHRSLQNAEACSDEALYRLKLDSSYTGGTLTFANGSCTIAVAGSGGTRTVTINSTVNDQTRDLQINVTLSSNTDTTADTSVITNWEEVN